jgi:dsDNA-specific endonuclease/ATPase MutS2
MADTKNQREQQGQNLTESARQTAQEAKNRIQEGATSAAHRAQEGISSVGHRIQETASQATHRASELASTAKDKTEQAVSSVGQRLTSLADTIQSNAPREGMIGSAASGVAHGLESSGRYLQEHDLQDMVNDVGSVIKRYPLASVCAFFSLGLLLGMSTRR